MKNKPTTPYKLTVLTFNNLVDFLQATLPPWEERKSFCRQVIREAQPDIIGFQEVSGRQLAFWRQSLPDFAYKTVKMFIPDELLKHIEDHYGHVPDRELNEVVLFFRRDLFDRWAEGHWWLSPTPDQHLSTGFGNIIPRPVVWLKLNHKPSGRDLVIFNTHFDRRAIAPMAEVYHQQIHPFAATKLSLISMGDFNTTSQHESYNLLLKDGWQDTYFATQKGDTSETQPEPATFIADGHLEGGRIDHIFCYGPHLKTTAWRYLTSPDPEKPLSDHYPVLAEFELT